MFFGIPLCCLDTPAIIKRNGIEFHNFSQIVKYAHFSILLFDIHVAILDSNTHPCVIIGIYSTPTVIKLQFNVFNGTDIVCVLQAKPEHSFSHARSCVYIAFSEFCWPGNTDHRMINHYYY